MPRSARRRARVGPEHVENWLVLALAVYARTGYAAWQLLENLDLHAAAKRQPALVSFLLHCFGYTASAIELLAHHATVVSAETLARLMELPRHDNWRKNLSPSARATVAAYRVDNLHHLVNRAEPSAELELIYYLEYALETIKPCMLTPGYGPTPVDQEKLKKLYDRECPEAYGHRKRAINEIVKNILDLEYQWGIACALVRHIRGE